MGGAETANEPGPDANVRPRPVMNQICYARVSVSTPV
jgi:hypothetical protein